MPASSALDLLKDRAFLTVWLAVILSFLGHFVHVIASAWVMTDLTHSATMVALVQTAASLPMELLSLVSGALADIFDHSQQILMAITIIGLDYFLEPKAHDVFIPELLNMAESLSRQLGYTQIYQVTK